ncbi:unnamed protein product, partial [Heterobilharzia americana]
MYDKKVDKENIKATLKQLKNRRKSGNQTKLGSETSVAYKQNLGALKCTVKTINQRTTK